YKDYKSNECDTLTYDKRENYLKCNLCPVSCKIKENQSGKCFVRENKDNKLILNNYGRIVCSKIDSLKSRPIYLYPSDNIKSLSIGLTGCNNRCPFCQNYKVSQSSKFENSNLLFPDDIVKKAVENKVDFISFTY